MGRRINDYTLSPDGRTLTMQVTETSPQLSQTITYKQVYRRVSWKEDGDGSAVRVRATPVVCHRFRLTVYISKVNLNQLSQPVVWRGVTICLERPAAGVFVIVLLKAS
jgi:hypothetical protein